MSFFTRHKKILASLMILIIVFGVLVAPTTGNVAHAQITGEGILERTIYPFMGNFAYMTLVGASVFLRVTATLLNTAIVQTLHISDLVKGNGAIESTWLIIRNFSNIFFIFMLLYAGIVMILDTKGPKFGELVKNIVIAGLLINFSLFFTKLAIDTSNVVALSFYKAIDAASPSQAATPENSTGWGQIKNTFQQSDVGLANAFMQGLKIQTIYSNSGRLLVGGIGGGLIWGVTLSLVIATAGGAIVMIIAGISFLVAAVMFLARIAILLLLMAFSPIFFIGMVLPEVQPYAKKWLDELIAQCMFAPLYLMFMYVVLRIVLDPAFGAFLGVTGTSNFAEEISKGGSVGLLVQYAIIIILINYGLAASKQYAGSAATLGNKVHTWANKKATGLGYGVAGFYGRNTLGRVAAIADDKLAKSTYGSSVGGLRGAISSSAIKALRGATTGAVAGSKFGSDKSFIDAKKETKENEAKRRELNAIGRLNTAIRDRKGDDIKTILEKMSDSEKSKLGKKTLSDSLVIPHISSKVYGLVDKSEMSEADKETIMEERKQHVLGVIKEGNTPELEKLFKGMDKDDRKKIVGDALATATGTIAQPSMPTTVQDMVSTIIKKERGEDLVDLGQEILTNPIVAQNLSESQLKDMEGMKPEVRRLIAEHIRSNRLGSLGINYINKKPSVWGEDPGAATTQATPRDPGDDAWL